MKEQLKMLISLQWINKQKTYDVTIRSNRLDETIRTNGHTIGFDEEMTKFLLKCILIMYI